MSAKFFDSVGAPPTTNDSATLVDYLERNARSLGWHLPFFYPPIAHVRFAVDARVLTACVDLTGRITFNPAWIKKLTKEELQFVIAHELGHLLLLHHARRGERKVFKWNLACFPAGTFLPSGVPIESAADMARTFSGSLRRIRTAVGAISATPEHPFFVRRRLPHRPIRLQEPQWVAASEIHVGDFICVPKIRKRCGTHYVDLRPYAKVGRDTWGRATFSNRVVNRRLILDVDLAWLIGLYVAEGSFTREDHGCQFSLGAHETQLIRRVSRIAKRLGYRPGSWRKGNSTRVVIGSPVLARWLSNICGRGAHHKHIPQFILHHADAKIRAAFIAGCALRSPRTGKKVGFEGATVSRALAFDLVLLLAQDGIGCRVHKSHHGPRWIGESWCAKEELIYHVGFRPDGGGKSTRVMNGHRITTQHARYKVDKHGVWYPVKEISEQRCRGQVYNRTTDDHTYIANSYLVHNCDAIWNATLKKIAAAGSITPLADMIYADEDQQEWTVEQLYQEMPDPKVAIVDLSQIAVGNGCGACSPEEGPGSGETGGRTEAGWRRLWREVAAQAQLRGRDAPSGLDAGNILARALEPPMPRVRWSEVLRQQFSQALSEAGKDDVSWLRRSRRSTPEIILPGGVTYRCRAAVAIDTSGSMSDEDLARAVAETAAIVNHTHVPTFLVVHDVEVQEACWLRPGGRAAVVSQVQKRLKGRGGTSFDAAYKRVEREGGKFNVLVHLTDGCVGSWPEKPPSVRRLVVALLGYASDALVPKDARVIRVEA